MGRNAVSVAVCWLVFLVGFNNAASQEYNWEKGPNLKNRHIFPVVIKKSETEAYIIGGWASGQFSGPSTSVDRLYVDGDQLRVEEVASMRIARAEFVGFLEGDTSIVVFGGFTSGNGVSNSVERYSFATKEWYEIGKLKEGRRQHAGLYLGDGKYLIVGGRRRDLSTYSTAEVFDVNRRVSESVASFPFSVNGAFGITVGNRHFVVGGRSGGPDDPKHRDIYEYVPSRNAWDVGQRMDKGREAPQLAMLRSGEAISIGGAYTEKSPYDFSDEILLGDENGWRIAAVGVIEMIYNAGAEFTDDVLVIAGGQDEQLRLSGRSQFIEIRTGRVTQGPDLNYKRQFHRAISFVMQSSKTPTGRTVVIVGGAGDDPSVPTSIEYLVSKCDVESKNLLDSKQFRLVGMASVTNEGVRITPSTGTAVGRMSSNVPLDGSSFDISVGLKLSRGTDNGYLDGGPQGADGIAMLFSTGIDRTYLGRNGEGLGYDGLPNVVVVEVDAYRNPANFDRDPQHVALMVPVQGVTSSRHDDRNTVAMKQLPFELTADGSVYDFRVSYDGSRLNVFASSAATGTQLVLSVPDFDIFERLGVARSTPLYASITSATGKSMQEHTIVRWNLEGCGAITSVDDDEDVNVRTGDNHESVLSFDATSREIVVAQALTSDIVVYDLTGNVVLRHGPSQIGQRVDVSLLPRGFYVASSGTTSISFIVHE